MSEPVRELRSVLSELKRRKVFRVAAVYAAVAFVVVQAAELLVPTLLLPDWILRAVVLALLLGFPVALVLAWAFELTPQGVRRSEHQPVERVTATPYRRAFFAAGVALAALLGAGLAAWYLGAGPIGGDAAVQAEDVGVVEAPVIAVLPFDNLSDSEENEYFSDGITEDILTQLSKIDQLRVISRQSVMRYKDTDLGMRDIADQLGATHIVEGSVRRAENQLRINAQLIDARADEHLWVGQYDRVLSIEAIFRIQSEIAGQVARELQTTLSPEFRGRLASAPTRDLTAYDYYLQGREYADGGTREDIERGIAFFKQAIAQDPDYALAHAALGFSYTALVGATGAPARWLDSAEVAARKAIELDPNAPESHSSLALVYWNSGRMMNSLDSYARALELRPNDQESLWGLAFVRWILGDLDEALRLARQAVTLGPYGHGYPLLGRCYMSLGEFAEAERAFRRALQLQPDAPWAHEDLILMHLVRGEHERAAAQLGTLGALRPASREFLRGSGWLAMFRGDHETARGYFEQAIESYPENQFLPLLELGFVYAKLGDDTRARELWRRHAAEAEEESRKSEGFGGSLGLGRVAAARGEHDEAVSRLEAAYERGWRGWPTIDIAKDPLLEGLREDLRFQELRNRILDDVERMRMRAREAEAGR